MAKSSKKLRRLVDLFRDLETAERANVATLARQISDVQVARQGLLEALANPTTSTEPFLPLISRNVGSMERKLQRLAVEQEVAIGRYVQASGRTRGAGSLLADAKAQEGREAEQKDLESLLEFQQSVGAQGRCKSVRST
jgi:hypothetical protein